jgi:hypothetical protein
VDIATGNLIAQWIERLARERIVDIVTDYGIAQWI